MGMRATFIAARLEATSAEVTLRTRVETNIVGVNAKASTASRVEPGPGGIKSPWQRSLWRRDK